MPKIIIFDQLVFHVQDAIIGYVTIGYVWAISAEKLIIVNRVHSEETPFFCDVTLGLNPKHRAVIAAKHTVQMQHKTVNKALNPSV